MIAIELDSVQPTFGEKYWEYDGQVKAERCHTDSGVATSGPELLRSRIANDSTIGTHLFTSCTLIDHALGTLVRIVATSMLEASVLFFHRKNTQ